MVAILVSGSVDDTICTAAARKERIIKTPVRFCKNCNLFTHKADTIVTQFLSKKG